MGILTGMKPVTFIVTTDRERAKAFYGGVLGLTQVAEDPFATVYDMGGISLRLSTVEQHSPSAHTVLGWDTPDIRAAALALKEKGVACTIYPGFGQDDLGIWSAPGGDAKVAWFTDPDGNVLSLTQS
jgi:catechol 2,3-dioxygenase-like lactoylglutathione lyase family enzyme